MQNVDKNTVKIIPLGGFEKIGMNMTVVESEESIIVIDCGTSFPPNNVPGIDTSIPDISYLIKNKDKVRGIIVTHGHEDHIGAIPYIIGRLNVPIYGTPLTIALVENKLKKTEFKKFKTKVIKQGNTITLGDFKVEFIKTNHSIPDAVMLAIYTSLGVIVNTGDFKIDLTPITGDPINLRRLSSLGSKGVLALLSDSTNALIEGNSPSEKEVSNALDQLFNRYRDNRLIIATFASNMDRVQQIIYLANKYNRKVILQGETMLDIFVAADKLGYLQLPPDTLIEMEDIDKYEDKEIVLLTTGNHGEPITYLSDIAIGQDDNIKIKPGDTILFSSIAVEGTEHFFSQVINNLEEQGASIVFQDIHATGHACSEELKLIYSLLTPQYAIPAHGQYIYRKGSARIAESIGIAKENIFLIRNGDILEIGENYAKVTGHLNLKEIFVEGVDVGEISGRHLIERRQLSEAGFVLAEIVIDHKSKRLMAAPKIVTRGFINEKSDLINELKDTMTSEIGKLINQGIHDERFQRLVKERLEDHIYNATKRRPLVVVSVSETVL